MACAQWEATSNDFHVSYDYHYTLFLGLFGVSDFTSWRESIFVELAPVDRTVEQGCFFLLLFIEYDRVHED